MSFSDFGSGRRPAPAPNSSSSGGASTATVGSTSSSVGSGSGNNTAAAPALHAISDSLLQYQQNVGILEKIVQSLNSNSINNNNNSNSRTSVSETIEQYEAQNHVLSHLEDKVQQLLSRQSSVTLNNNNIHSNNSNQQQHALSVVKLQRDFQRVQTRVGQLQEAASKRIVMLRQQQKQVNNQRNNPFGNRSGDGSRLSPFGSGDDSTEDEFMFQQQHQQLQLQEDRLQEEIMREREEEIRNINKGMHTVNEIYKDLAHIVGQQQDHIDQIETQMEDSRANADSGLQQVEKANEKYGNSQCVIM